MSEWQNKSDFEINKAVASKLGCKVVEDFKWEKEQCWVKVRSLDGDVEIFDYCDEANDAWPIIISNNIVVTPCMGNNAGDATGYLENQNPIALDFYENKHALRAAMIVYLEMNGVKP